MAGSFEGQEGIQLLEAGNICNHKDIDLTQVSEGMRHESAAEQQWQAV